MHLKYSQNFSLQHPFVVAMNYNGRVVYPAPGQFDLGELPDQENLLIVHDGIHISIFWDLPKTCNSGKIIITILARNLY